MSEDIKGPWERHVHFYNIVLFRNFRSSREEILLREMETMASLLDAAKIPREPTLTVDIAL